MNFNEAHLRDGIHRRIVDSKSPRAWDPTILTTEERRTRSINLDCANLTEDLISAIRHPNASL